jgi:endoglucanase
VRVARKTISAIRAIDPKRLIITDGYPIGKEPIQELFDTGIMQSAHDYVPSQVTAYGNPWVRYPGSDKAPLPTWPVEDTKGKIIWDKQMLEAHFRPWGELAKYGVPIHFGELGCSRHTPSNVAYPWYSDTLDMINGLNSGWALWNFRGPFGILDTERVGTQYKNWHGHQLDSTLLNLLQSKMNA